LPALPVASSLDALGEFRLGMSPRDPSASLEMALRPLSFNALVVYESSVTDL